MSAPTGEGAEMVTVTVDAETADVIVAALDLYQRAAIGQWDRLVDHAEGVERSVALGDALLALRAAHASDHRLVHPNAGLSIATAPRRAQIAYDLWHALGGGMVERQQIRLTDAAITVDRDGLVP